MTTDDHPADQRDAPPPDPHPARDAAPPARRAAAATGSARTHRRLFLANATVLLAHQVEAAYWQEWRLFGLPGGVQLYVLLNVPLLLATLLGFEQLEDPLGRGVSFFLGAGGLFAAVFHSAHLLAGDEAFRTPVSLTILGLTAMLSPAQLLVAGNARRAARHAELVPALPR